jgi:hypothetical protein
LIDFTEYIISYIFLCRDVNTSDELVVDLENGKQYI